MFDCFDGYFARKHDMITVFGDWYDHITDWLVVLLLCYVIYKNKNINSKSKLYAFSGLILMFAFSAIFVGCEQKFNNNPNPSLKIFESACKDDIDYNLTTFKDVSMGTLTIYIFLVLLVFQYSKQL
jgi:phosphatidylglycerophosphate synthase